MPGTLSLCAPEKAADVAAEIEISKTLKLSMIQSDNLLIIHHIAKPVGEYWDIAYGDQMSDDEIGELVDLEENVFKRTGCRLMDIQVERQENNWPHPNFVSGASHTYVRLCPKVALP